MCKNAEKILKIGDTFIKITILARSSKLFFVTDLSLKNGMYCEDK